jgi:DNA-directed RNA polymerase specialized sigma24 family protein
MNANDLYRTLECQVKNLTTSSVFDINDIRQELYLLCIEVAEGRSSYTPLLGNPHAFIMGRLWWIVRRWAYYSSNLVDLDDENPDEVKIVDNYLDEITAPSVEEVLCRRAEMLEQDALDIEEIQLRRTRTVHQSTLTLLVQGGYWSSNKAAKFCGVSRQAIDKACRRAES